MKRLTMMLCLALAFVAFATPLAEANKFNPSSGTKFKMKVGQKVKVTTTGFGGCTFETIHKDPETTDADVAVVSTPGQEGKKQVVEIEAVGVGTTMVSLETVGKDSGCFGFQASYMVEVEGDLKAFEKQAKGKFKASLKQTKTAIGPVLDDYCELLDSALDSVKANELSADEALEESLAAIQVVANFADQGVALINSLVYADVWGRATQQGFSEMSPDLQGYLIGGCGEMDGFLAASTKLIDKLIADMRKKHKKFQKQLAKQADDEVLALIGEIFPGLSDLRTVIEIPVPMPLPQPAPPPKPLKKNFTSSGRMASNPVSRLHIGGSADPAGGDVSVTITGPDDVETMLSGSVNVDCEWEVDFGSLPPGSYKVELTQGTSSVEFLTIVI